MNSQDKERPLESKPLSLTPKYTCLTDTPAPYTVDNSRFKQSLQLRLQLPRTHVAMPLNNVPISEHLDCRNSSDLVFPSNIHSPFDIDLHEIYFGKFSSVFSKDWSEGFARGTPSGVEIDGGKFVLVDYFVEFG